MKSTYEVTTYKSLNVLSMMNSTLLDIQQLLMIKKLDVLYGNEFTVRPEGSSYEHRKKLNRNATKYIGKKLTMKFQAYTKGGVPLFPVGISIRDYE
jgi:hypothetical protein